VPLYAGISKFETISMEQAHRDNSLPAHIRLGLPRLLPEFLVQQRWFGGKARSIESAEILEVIPIAVGQRTAFLILARLKYTEGADDLYALPLIPLDTVGSQDSENTNGASTLRLKFERESQEIILANAFGDKSFSLALLDLMHNSSSIAGEAGVLSAIPAKSFHDAPELGSANLEPSLMKAEQSNTSVRYGNRYILKFFRRLEEGINPDLEIGVFLTEKASFEYAPPLCGTFEYRRSGAPAIALGILQAFVPNQGDAWRYTLGALEHFFQNLSSSPSGTKQSSLPSLPFMELCKSEFPPDVSERIGSYWDSAALLGRRTAQLHLALASGIENPDFRPEEFSSAFQRSQWESMRDLTSKVFRILGKRIATLPGPIQGVATTVLGRESEILGRLELFTQQKMTAELIRIHGDYHLGQVLYTGSDFVIIDFEGEPARSLEERRKKRCPVQDVAGMLRSFHYAAYTGLADCAMSQDADSRAYDRLEQWAQYWQRWISVRFLKEYLTVAGECAFLPKSEEEFAVLLNAYLLEKAVYELGYELNNRPDWVRLPLQGILQLIGPRK
jgi:maltose alpha-D-glucosyltransferase / alpha-amylase